MAFMSYDGIGTEATIDRDSVESMAQGSIGEIGADAEETSGGDVRNGEEQSNASRSGGATGGGRRILPRGNDTLVETLRTADSNRLRVLGISEEQWIERCHLNGLPQRRRSLHPIQPEGRKRLEFWPLKSDFLAVIHLMRLVRRF